MYLKLEGKKTSKAMHYLVLHSFKNLYTYSKKKMIYDFFNYL